MAEMKLVHLSKTSLYQKFRREPGEFKTESPRDVEWRRIAEIRLRFPGEENRLLRIEIICSGLKLDVWLSHYSRHAA